MGYWDRNKFEELNGRTITAVRGLTDGSEEVIFECADGTSWRMWHCQDCCESVSIADIIGDVSDLVDAKVLSAREEVSEQHPEGYEEPKYGHDSFTWTFYLIQTNKGHITLRWLGESNGYYSESVSFQKIGAEEYDS